jgi:hypothetical protein
LEFKIVAKNADEQQTGKLCFMALNGLLKITKNQKLMGIGHNKMKI